MFYFVYCSYTRCPVGYIVCSDDEKEVTFGWSYLDATFRIIIIGKCHTKVNIFFKKSNIMLQLHGYDFVQFT